MDSEEASDKFIAYNFIQGTNRIRIGKLREDLANQFSLCINSYPCDLANTKNMIINYVNNPNEPKKKYKQPKKDSEK